MDDLKTRGQAALDYLWARAQSEDTPCAERVELYKYFVALGIGTPRKLGELGGGAEPADGCGVIFMPAVDEFCDDLSRLTV